MYMKLKLKQSIFVNNEFLTIRRFSIKRDSLGAIIAPTPKITFGRIETQPVQGPGGSNIILKTFISEWTNTFSPRYNAVISTTLVNYLLIHFYTFNSLINTSFVEYLVINKRNLVLPSYFKVIFDILARGTRTNFTSRLEGETNSLLYSKTCVEYLLKLREDKTLFIEVLSNLPFGIPFDSRMYNMSYRHFCDITADLASNVHNVDDSRFYASVLSLNNLCNLSLHSVVGRTSSFTLVESVIDKWYTNSLNLYKFRNYSPGIYAIQEKGLDSMNETSTNLTYIILFLFQPTLYSLSQHNDLASKSVIGKFAPIPNDLLIDTSRLYHTEVFSSLFSLKETFSHVNNDDEKPLGEHRNPLGRGRFNNNNNNRRNNLKGQNHNMKFSTFTRVRSFSFSRFVTPFVVKCLLL